MKLDNFHDFFLIATEAALAKALGMFSGWVDLKIVGQFACVQKYRHGDAD